MREAADDGRRMMNVTSALVFPSEITPGDEVWDFHDGHGNWAKVVAVSSGNQELLVWCDADPEPLHLPASHRVEAHFVVPTAEAEDVHVGHMNAVEERMSGWYAGDLASAVSAVAEHREDVRTSAHTTIELEPHFHGWYPGDLDYVMEHAR